MEELGKKLTVETSTINDLLNTRYPLIVPSYQRAYAWDEDEIGDFLGDLESIYNRPADAEPGYHFMGSIVTAVEPKVGVSGWAHSYEVIDGQQRLATFGMLLAALIGKFKQVEDTAQSLGQQSVSELAGAHATLLVDDCLMFRPIIGSSRVLRPRIELSGVDARVYSSLISGEDPNDYVDTGRESHALLLSAFTKITSFVHEYSEDASLDLSLEKLLSLERVFLYRTYLVHMMAQDRQEGKRLFSVINNRGKNLSAGDLLRSATLEIGEGSEDASRRMEGAWDNILRDRPSRVDDFLMTVFASYQGHRAKKYLIFEEFMSAFFPEKMSPDECATAVERLEKDLSLYSQLNEGEWPYGPTEAKKKTNVTEWDRSRLYQLVKEFDNTLAIPLLMAGCLLPEEDFARLVHLIERVTFRYKVIVGAHVTPLSKVYYRHAKQIRKEPENYHMDSLIKDLSRLLEKEASDERFQDELQAKLVYGRGNNRLIRYYLAMVESYLDSLTAGRTPPRPERSVVHYPNQLTVEHVYSQNPSETISDLDDKTDYLGNLTIFGPDDNQTIGNLRFAEKKPYYSASRYKLNHALAQYDRWTEYEYLDRTKTLKDYGMIIFSCF